MAFTGQLTGNIGRDPELKYLDNGQTVANFTVAVRQPRRQGQEQEARWVKVAIWGKAAEYVGNYVKKGDAVMLVGRVGAPEVFTRRDGTTGIAETFTADNVEKFGERQDQQQPTSAAYAQASQRVAPPAPAPVAAATSDEIPF
jgi:single-strand DNA-binding protein